MASAISGCVLAGEHGGSMNYKNKCDSCGYVAPGISGAPQKQPSGQYHSAFMCPKCKKSNKVIIQW